MSEGTGTITKTRAALFGLLIFAVGYCCGLSTSGRYEITHARESSSYLLDNWTGRTWYGFWDRNEQVGTWHEMKVQTP